MSAVVQPQLLATRAPVTAPSRGERVLEVRELSKQFRSNGKVRQALDGVSFDVGAGEIVVLLGRNGAGKTTTMKVVLGLITPDSGEVIRHGSAAADSAGGNWCGATLEGGRNLYWRLTPVENLEYYGVLRGMTRRAARQRASELVERFGLNAAHSDVMVQKLSRGLQQRLAIAVALVHRPRILVLDEPTLGVDFEGTQVLLDCIQELRSEGIGIVFSTHQLSIAEAVSDRTVIIRDGRVVADRMTAELVLELTDNRFELEVGAALTAQQLTLVRSVGAQVDAERISVQGDAATLGVILNAIGKTPLVRLAQIDMSLEAAYRKYTR